MADGLNFSISYSGQIAEDHEIDFYDAAQALVGFQRSLALTIHLALNGEIITQAPSLKGASINITPPEEGSWKTTATVICAILGGVYTFGTAPKDTPIGNLARSMYDYMISETLGVHVDYNTTIGQQIDELKSRHPELKKITPEKMDSLAEKCEVAVVNMHRPIAHSQSATQARITTGQGRHEKPLGPPLSFQTYEYVVFTTRSDAPITLAGRVSSYNMNTYKGRIYVEEYQRPIPFELSSNARDAATIGKVTNSLSANAQHNGPSSLTFVAFQDFSRTGRLKKLFIVEIQ